MKTALDDQVGYDEFADQFAEDFAIFKHVMETEKELAERSKAMGK